MRVVRDKYLELHPANKEERDVIYSYLEEKCVRDNPEYIEMMNSGRWKAGVFKKTKTYKERYGYFQVYKGNLDVYTDLIKMNVKITDFTDNRVQGKPININMKNGYSPRDEQQKECLDIFKAVFDDWGYGLIDATPGFGKSYIGCDLVTTLNTKTLILVDMDLLVDQWIEYFEEYTDVNINDIGLIKGKLEQTDKKIIISTVQTLVKKEKLCKELAEEIGFLIVDEVHVASTDTFQKIIPRFKPMYQLGLSGSHERDDKMDFLIKEAMGPIYFSADRQRAISDGSIINPVLRPLFFRDEWSFKNKEMPTDFRKVVDEYYLNPKVITRLSNLMKHHYNAGDSQLIICKEHSLITAYYEEIIEKMIIPSEEKRNFYKQHLEKLIENKRSHIISINEMPYIIYATNLQQKAVADGKKKASEFKKTSEKKKAEAIKKAKKQLEKLEKTKWYETERVKEETKINEVRVVTGKTSKEERDRIVEMAKRREVKILIVTTIMDKAISINCLNVLYLLFSTREMANLKQRCGRVGRPAKGKNGAIVYDVIYDHPYSFFQFSNGGDKNRLRALREVTQVHPAIDRLTWWLSCRFKDKPMPSNVEKDFLTNHYKKFVVDI